MANSYFQFKQFTVHQDRCAMKVTTDSCLFGAWVAETINNSEPVRPAGGLIINNCVDIGTGTGLLSLMLAQKYNGLIHSIEIDSSAAEQAKENIDASPFAEKIQIIHVDAKEFLFEKKYDIMISNPPFYEKELKGHDDQKNIAHHNEGLLLSELLEIIKQNLKAEGTFFLLLPFKRTEEIKKLITDKELSISKMIFVRQTTEHDYFRIMISGTHYVANEIETVIDEIAIKDEKGDYTSSFNDLLKDYYLHL